MRRKASIGLIALALILVISLMACAAPTPTAAPTTAPATTAAPTKTPAAPAETVEWRMTTPSPRTTSLHYLHIPLCERIAAASGGRFIIKDYAGGELYAAAEALDNIQMGTNEMIATYRTYFQGKDPGMLAIYLPADPLDNHLMKSTLFHSAEWKAFEEKLWGQFDATCIGYHPGGAYTDLELFAKVKPMYMADFKGLKMRTTGLGAKMMNAAGVETVWLAGDELYTALATGTIDMTEYSDWKMDWELGLQEVTKYVCESPVHEAIGGGDYVVNTEAFNALPDDLKQILLDEVEAQWTWMLQENYRGFLPYRKNWIDYGVEVYKYPQETMDAYRVLADQVIEEQIAASPMFAEGMLAQRKTAILFGIWQEGWAKYPELAALH